VSSVRAAMPSGWVWSGSREMGRSSRVMALKDGVPAVTRRGGFGRLSGRCWRLQTFGCRHRRCDRLGRLLR
jgi:hypothetical protein